MIVWQIGNYGESDDRIRAVFRFTRHYLRLRKSEIAKVKFDIRRKNGK